MAVLVTGASGFLGRHVIETLSRRESSHGKDSDIFVLVRSLKEWMSYDWTRHLPRVKPVVGELFDVEGLISQLGDIKLEGIYHLAALVRHSVRHADEVERVNVNGTLTMVRLAASHGCRMVFVSTSGAVGCFTDPHASADETFPYCESTVSKWPYYASKIRAEREAVALARELDVSLVRIRPPILLGPGDHRFRSTGLVLRFLRGKLPFLLKGGVHFVDVRDVAHAVVQAMRQANVQPVYHLPGTCYSVDDFFTDLERVSGTPRPRMHLPFIIAHAIARADERLGLLLKGEPLSFFPEPVVVEMGAHYWGLKSLHAAKDLQFQPRPKDVTLRDTVEWIRAHRDDAGPRSAALNSEQQAA